MPVERKVTPTSVVASVPFSQPGAAEIGESGVWTAPGAGEVTVVRLSCVTAPAGSGLVVEFHHDGVTFETLTIAAGSTTAVTDSPGEAFALADEFSVEATSVGSGTAATGVVAQMDYELS